MSISTNKSYPRESSTLGKPKSCGSVGDHRAEA